MRVRFNDAAMLDLTGLPMLVQAGQTVNIDSSLAKQLIRSGLAAAIPETTDARSERSHACTPFQQSDARRQVRQRPSQ